MTSIHIEESSIPTLEGKVAIITGGASGIGHAAAQILASKGAKVHILDLNPPVGAAPSPQLEYHHCDVTDWVQLRDRFNEIGRVDMAFANAGVSEEMDYFADVYNSDDLLMEPTYGVLNVNVRAVINFVKLAVHAMKRQGVAGSIVVTTSATAYAPEQSLPVYAAGKSASRLWERGCRGRPRKATLLAFWREQVCIERANLPWRSNVQLVGLIRAMRSTLPRHNITINGVAPAATITQLLPAHLAAPIIAAGLPVSNAHFVGLALVYSATATEKRRVEAYGKLTDGEREREGRWNGRVILTLGDRYTELEEAMSGCRETWFGKENLRLTRMQQAATDFGGQE